MTRWLGWTAAVVVHGLLLFYNAVPPSEDRRREVRVSVSVQTGPQEAKTPSAPSAPARSPRTPAPSLPVQPAVSAVPAAVSSGTETGTAEAESETAAGGAEADPVSGYLARLHQAVAEHRTYPYAARTRGQEGVVLLEFRLDDSGRLEEPPKIVVSSGYPRLDAAGAAAIAAAAPFAPPPENARPWDFQIPVEFQLR